LDERFGAGQVNVLHSYQIIALVSKTAWKMVAQTGELLA